MADTGLPNKNMTWLVADLSHLHIVSDTFVSDNDVVFTVSGLACNTHFIVTTHIICFFGMQTFIWHTTGVDKI